MINDELMTRVETAKAARDLRALQIAVIVADGNPVPSWMVKAFKDADAALDKARDEFIASPVSL